MAPGGGGDEGDHLLAVAGIRAADHCRHLDCGMLEQGVLDIAGVDVEATTDDQVLLAVDDEQVAVLVEIAEIAGVQPAVTQRLAAGLGRTPVSLHYGGGAADDL